MSNWKNTSSYSQGDTERVPNSMSMTFKKLRRLIVHRHRDYPGTWRMTVDDLISNRELLATDLEDAKREALETLRDHLAEACREVVDALVEES